jgi:hypothetical protein
MNPILRYIVPVCTLALVVAGVARADSADSGEERLRETLRATMLQLRDAQTELANLQATQAGQADDKKALADELALLKKHNAEDRAAADKALEELKAKVTAQARELDLLNQRLVAWKAAAARASEAARTTEAERARSEQAAVFLQRRVDDLKSKNLALYELGNEILTRYEKFSLGEQFLAREPFIGRARVRLENQIQDYDDKLVAQRADP